MVELFAYVLLATTTGPAIVRPQLPGFVVGSEQAAGASTILEEVPKGETVEKWSRMVTTQHFGGLARRATASMFLHRLADGAAQSCVGAIASNVQGSDTNANVRLDCPLNPATGLPETFIARAVITGDDLNIFQIAWRKTPSIEDLAWGQAYLEGVSIKP